MAVQIQVRRDSAADWTSANPTLAQGEIGYETDTGKVKVGDGTTAWASLAYAFAVSSHTHTPSAVQFTATDKLLGRVSSGAGAGEEVTCTAAGRAIIDDASNTDQRTTLGLGDSATKNVGTGATNVAAGDHTHSGVYQPADSELTALAGLTSAADALPYFTGSGTASTTTLTTAGRALIDDASAADQRTTLGLGDAATKTVDAASGVAGLNAASQVTKDILVAANPADGSWSGVVVSLTAGTDVVLGDLCYLAAADSRMEKTDADAEGTSGTVGLGIALETKSDGQACLFLLMGTVSKNGWGLTAGSIYYISGTAGAITSSAPTGANVVNRVVGWAVDSTTLMFLPNNSWVKRAS